jgi:patatin-like phospholipase/acyl hydrolase
MDEIRPFKVLCLDGGGMRGIYQATYLNTTLERINSSSEYPYVSDVGSSFDLIVGTSTGGIVACALAAGVSLDKVIDLYTLHGKDIFPYQSFKAIPLLGQIIRASGLGLRDGDNALRAVLTDIFGKSIVGSIYSE